MDLDDWLSSMSMKEASEDRDVAVSKKNVQYCSGLLATWQDSPQVGANSPKRGRGNLSPTMIART